MKIIEEYLESELSKNFGFYIENKTLKIRKETSEIPPEEVKSDVFYYSNSLPDKKMNFLWELEDSFFHLFKYAPIRIYWFLFDYIRENQKGEEFLKEMSDPIKSILLSTMTEHSVYLPHKENNAEFLLELMSKSSTKDINLLFQVDSADSNYLKYNDCTYHKLNFVQTLDFINEEFSWEDKKRIIDLFIEKTNSKGKVLLWENKERLSSIDLDYLTYHLYVDIENMLEDKGVVLKKKQSIEEEVNFEIDGNLFQEKIKNAYDENGVRFLKEIASNNINANAKLFMFTENTDVFFEIKFIRNHNHEEMYKVNMKFVHESAWNNTMLEDLEFIAKKTFDLSVNKYIKKNLKKDTPWPMQLMFNEAITEVVAISRTEDLKNKLQPTLKKSLKDKKI